MDPGRPDPPATARPACASCSGSTATPSTAIIQLRAFRRDRIPVCYQLLEIPTTIFASIDDAPLDTFQREAPAVPCLIDGQCVAVVAVDRSDAKITVRKIRLSACTVHVEWHRR